MLHLEFILFLSLEKGSLWTLIRKNMKKTDVDSIISDIAQVKRANTENRSLFSSALFSLCSSEIFADYKTLDSKVTGGCTIRRKVEATTRKGKKTNKSSFVYETINNLTLIGENKNSFIFREDRNKELWVVSKDKQEWKKRKYQFHARGL